MLALDTLSDLNAAELARFQATWAQLSQERRRGLVARLLELAEERVDVSFCSIFIWLLADPDPWIRAQAIEGFWEEEDVRLVVPLTRLLQEDLSPEVRAAAALALGHYVLLTELEELEPAIGNPVIEALLGACKEGEPSVEVRRRALESLAYSGLPEIHSLIRMAYEDDDDALRVSAVFAMGRSADPRWRPLVLAELSSTDAAMRFEAARASGELEMSEAVSQLIDLVDEADVEIRNAAIWALGRIGGHEARRVLRACCASTDESLADAAQEALDELEFLSGDDELPAFLFEA
jgi:HEAT repeat protein